MPDQSAQRRALRLLDEEIIHIETEILPQLTATPAPFYTHWQAYVTHARLLPATLRLQQLYEERRRLWAESGE
jgi:hypothetical protein